MAQTIYSNKDILSFGKYRGKSIFQAHIKWLMWAKKVGAIIINNKDLELELYKRDESYDESIAYTGSHWADNPFWGDDF